MGSLEIDRSSRRRVALCPAYCPATGRPPYGYRRRNRSADSAFEPDPLTAPVVRRIFDEYVNGSGLQAIAERLTAAGIPRPSAYDARRNPHHQGSAWSKAAVRAIITNGRYAVEYPAAEAGSCARCGRGCASRHQATLVPAEIYQQTQHILATRGGTARGIQSQAVAGRRYALRGLLRCELCQRLMQGTWNNSAAYYRCRFPREYARAHGIEHPTNVYVREDRLLEPLLNWVCQSLPVRLNKLAEAHSPAARARLAERCQDLRELVNAAIWDRSGSGELYRALGMRLTYHPYRKVVEVRTVVLPDTVVAGSVELLR